MRELHDAIVRLAYAEKAARSAVVSGDDGHLVILDLIAAARQVRHAYRHILEIQNGKPESELLTRPKFKQEQ